MVLSVIILLSEFLNTKVYLMGIKTIIFDFGGVLIDLFPLETVKAFDEVSPLDVLSLYESGFRDPEYKGIEVSSLSVNQFRDFLKKSLELDISDHDLDNIWNMMLKSISPEKIEFVRSLSEKYELALLSNTNKIHKDFFEIECIRAFGEKGLMEVFDKLYYSHEIKFRKPSKEVFKYVLDDLSREASECLFIDDSVENIMTAKELGFKTLLFKRNDSFDNYLDLSSLLD